MLTTIPHIRKLEKHNKEKEDMVQYYGEQLETIRNINKNLSEEIIALADKARAYKRQTNLLLPLVISLLLLLATPII